MFTIEDSVILCKNLEVPFHQNSLWMNYYLLWHEPVCKVVCVGECFALLTSVYSVCSQFCLLCLFPAMVIIIILLLCTQPLIPRIQRFQHKVLLMVHWRKVVNYVPVCCFSYTAGAGDALSQC